MWKKCKLFELYNDFSLCLFTNKYIFYIITFSKSNFDFVKDMLKNDRYE